MTPQPPHGSKHILVRALHDGSLRIEIRPTATTRVVWVASVASVAVYAWYRISRTQEHPARSFYETPGQKVMGGILIFLFLPFALVLIAGALYGPFGSEVVVIGNTKLTIRQRIMANIGTDECDLRRISTLRYEPVHGRGYRATIQFSDPVGMGYTFGKDLTEAEARWLIGVIKSRMDA